MTKWLTAAGAIFLISASFACREEPALETRAKQDYARKEAEMQIEIKERALEQRADELEQRIDALSARWERARDRWSRDIRPRGKDAENELKEQLEDARRRIDELGSASKEDWRSLETRAQAEIDDLERRVEAALSAS